MEEIPTSTSNYTITTNHSQTRLTTETFHWAIFLHITTTETILLEMVTIGSTIQYL